LRSDLARRPSRKKVRVALAAVACGAVIAGSIQYADAAGPATSATTAHATAAATTATTPTHAAAFTDPPTGSSSVANLGAANGWKVLTSATATQGGGAISTPGFSTSGWLTAANDGGGAPGTEISALLRNGSCPNVYFSANMKTCFGQMTKVGADTIAQFSVPWWYRTDFTAPPSGQAAKLILNGVVGKADVWVNGSEVATSSAVTGDYSQNVLDITSLLTPGTNSLAIEVYPNNPNSMLTLDNVDWSQIPPDNNTGIQFPVQLQTGGPLVIGNAHVNQSTASNLSSSALTVKADVSNVTGSSQTGAVTATVTPPNGGAPITVSQSVMVAAHATTTATFAPASYPALNLSSPQIWWPYQEGAQPLYTLAASVAQGSTTLNSTSETFGIRTVTSSLVGAGSAAPSGVRRFAINGVPLVIRGGGWDPDLFLRYDPADTTKQIALMKAMGLNTVRLEGHFMPADWYQQMDAAGILVNAGYQCCDYWENSGSAGSVYQNSAKTQGAIFRNHPSVFSFQWSDNAPSSTQESQALTGFAAADYPGPFISSAEYNSGSQLGVSGEKEGPYDWVPSNYWYDTSHFPSGDSTLTNAGGAWAFDSEQSAGDTVPTIDSINRFLSAADQSALWQNTSANQFHTNYEGTGHSGYSFGTLFNLDQAISSRYGSWSSLSQYVEEAQAQNYENTRAQFEAYIAHSTNSTQPSTGTIYWQMNKGWPTLLWSLYNNDGDQAGAYFGAQQANRALHALFTLDNHTVSADNLSGTTQSGLTVESKVYNTSGTLLDDQTSGTLSLNSQQVAGKVLTPKLPSTSNTVYFVELLLKQNGNLVDRNVYWDSTMPDAVNWGSTIPSGGGNPQATMSSYANLKALQSLPTASISATASSSSQAGPDGADRLVTVTVKNTSATPVVGFLLRADLRRGTASGGELSGDNQVTSAIWNDNDVTLWPGESETLTAPYRSADLQGATPVVSVYGWNAPKIDVVAGTGTVANDFSLAVSPNSGSVTAGSSATATVSTSVTSGSAQPITLTASNLPSGATASFNPNPVTAGASSTLTITTTSSSTAAGTYPITITGAAASGSHTATYSLIVTSSTGSGCTPAQLLVNPGFESGSSGAPWTQSSTLGFNPITQATSAEPAHSGSWIAWFNGNGSKDTDTIAQSLSIPSGCKAALAYWLHIDSTENTTTAAPDTFTVQVISSSGAVLATVGSFSNLNKASGYTQHSADLSAYAGQSVTLKFTGSETDASGGTTDFVIDDTALNTN
jgi:exo-1,4-beta-D-glucosaminidase